METLLLLVVAILGAFFFLRVILYIASDLVARRVMPPGAVEEPGPRRLGRAA